MIDQAHMAAMQAGGPPGPAAGAPPAALQPQDPSQVATPEPSIPVQGDPTDPQAFAAMLAQDMQDKLMQYAQMLDGEQKAKLQAAAHLAQQDMAQILQQVMDTAAQGAATFNGPQPAGP